MCVRGAMHGGHLFLLGGGGRSGPPAKAPPRRDDELEDEADVIFRPPPPGSLMANVSPSLSDKSFLGPVGRCGDGASSISGVSSLDRYEARLAAAF